MTHESSTREIPPAPSASSSPPWSAPPPASSSASRRACARRARPLPPEIAWVRARYTQVLAQTEKKGDSRIIDAMVRASELPLCGTWTISTPAIALKSSPAR